MRFVSRFKPASVQQAIIAIAVVLAILVASWYIVALRGANADANAEIYRLEGEIGKANSTIQWLWEQEEIANAEIRRLEGEVGKANAELRRLEEEIGKANAEISRLEGEVDKGNQAISEANSIIRQQNTALAEAQSGGSGDLGSIISLGCLFLGLPC